jgi:hypothetical protein
MALARALTSLGGIPHIVRLPCQSKDTKTGLDDFLVAFGQEKFKALIDSTTPVVFRPTITITPSDLPRVVDEAEAALLAADLDFYQRGQTIVRPASRSIQTHRKNEIEVQRLVRVNKHHLMETLTRCATFVSVNPQSGAQGPIDCPLKIAETYLAREGHWKLPVLKGIINAPTLRDDGSILDHPGYDQATQLLYDPQGIDFGDIEPNPTQDDAKAALSTLRELITTFPFVSDADYSVALSTILTAVICRSIPACPLHGFTAPIAGSGKSMLVDIASIIATGHPAAVIAQGKTEEELEKRLDSALLASDQMISIDNCEQPLGGEKLCTLITGTTAKIRPLGRSELVQVPSNTFITATGNNLMLVGDMTRRALLCCLDPKSERPELRQFEFSPITIASTDRPRFVRASLTILRAYWCAKRPPQDATPLGSFDDWCRWIRDPLIWLGETDPVATMERVRESDPKLNRLKNIIQLWEASLGNAPVTAKQVISTATNCSDFEEALLTVVYGNQNLSSNRLGVWLSANKNRIVNGKKFVQDGTTGGVVRWRLDGALPIASTKQADGKYVGGKRLRAVK